MAPLGTSAVPLQLGHKAYESVRRRLRDLSGIQVGPSKQTLVSSRLQMRASRLGLPSVHAYVEALVQGGLPGEWDIAVDLLTTNGSCFYREPAHFELVERQPA